ncbi:caspase family protein [Chitinophaga defluvii]|uniref:Caspase family protein n=1 Tax=Chitinophaga defluvii TaxID=3163343 RepID=A0ABV2T214_9BACT
MSKLYALLAGINQYHPQSRVPSLQGCHNDVLHLQQFLEQVFPAQQREIKVFLDEQATYDQIVGGFGADHLLKAGKEDTVLFVFSGHGSREPAASELTRYFPEGMLETLVCYDSRLPGHNDLADKEMAVLIEQVAKTGAHVVVILDSCHSGSATRFAPDVQLGSARHTTSRSLPRTYKDYLQGYFEARFPGGEGFYLPASRHILLSACDRKEKAYELSGTPGGAFSHYLLKVLQESQGKIAYADLYTACRLEMAKVSDQQHPQFETYGFFNGCEGFLKLGGGVATPGYKLYNLDGQWKITAGAINGLPASPDKVSVFEVWQDGNMLGHAQTQSVGLDESIVAPDFNANPLMQYECRAISISVLPQGYALKTAKPEQKDLVEKALQTFQPVYFSLQENITQAPYTLEVKRDEIRIIRNADGFVVRTLEGDNLDPMLQDAFEKLETIGRWEKTLQLENEATGIKAEEVQLILAELDAEGEVVRKTAAAEVIVEVLVSGGKEQPVPFRIEVRNNHPSWSYHCALFYASGSYGFMPAGFNEEVPAQKTIWAMDRDANGNRFDFKLNGKPEATDILKLFISTQKIDAHLLEIKGFVPGETVSYWTKRGAKELPATAASRDIMGLSAGTGNAVIRQTDWRTNTMRIKCVARLAEVGPGNVSLPEAGITVLGHPALTAGLELSAVANTSRNIEDMVAIIDLANNYDMEILPLGTASRGTATPNMLTLTDIRNTETLTAHPLQLEIAANLVTNGEAEEYLLPVTFDGVHFLPVGEVTPMDNGKVRVDITHIPDMQDLRRKSLGKALKLCFLKLVFKRKDLQYLRWVDYSKAEVERMESGLKGKVQAAEDIVLMIHGIIGDTKEMAESLREAYGANGKSLVMTFDYENLNTSIEDTAGLLLDKLREAGITINGNKKITIVAHSMGGLVTRYLVEHLSGRAFVKRVILLGTPSAGAAIARVTAYRDVAVMLLSLGLNAPIGKMAIAVLLGILRNTKWITPTLEEMDMEKSVFLKNLAKSADPGIPYYLIAGNVADYLQKNIEQQNLMDKMYKLGARLSYGNEPNDIAVSQTSVYAVPEGRNPAVVSHEVACHHMNYFIDTDSKKVLYDILSNGTPR